MTTRRRLPNRRRSEVLDYDINGSRYTASVGYYNDDRVGEIFLRSAKSGTHVNIAMIEIAVAVSMALQHGCDMDTLRAAMPRTEDGMAEGAMGRLLDLLARKEPTLEVVT
jgi:hypothetical protein